MRVYVNERFRELGLMFAAPRDGDAGYDLFTLEGTTLQPGERQLLSTGLHVEIPDGYVGLVKDRSSTALAGLHNLAGVIDASYRGEVKILVLNVGDAPYTIEVGQKIAQMVVIPCYTQSITYVDTVTALASTERGDGGFGSTGK